MSDNARKALEELQKYNKINNDLEAYLYELTEWGLGKRSKPNLSDYVSEKEVEIGWRIRNII